MTLKEGRILRDLELDLFEQVKATELLERLRQVAHEIFLRTMEPVSANDIQDAYEATGYAGHPSVLGTVFRRPMWTPVGYTQATGAKKHARTIRLWVPTWYAVGQAYLTKSAA